MTDRIDAAMQTVQPAHSDAPQDSVLVHSQCSQLSRRKDAVLPAGKSAQHQVGRGAFLAHNASKAPGAAGSPPLRLESPAQCGYRTPCSSPSPGTKRPTLAA